MSGRSMNGVRCVTVAGVLGAVAVVAGTGLGVYGVFHAGAEGEDALRTGVASAALGVFVLFSAYFYRRRGAASTGEDEEHAYVSMSGGHNHTHNLHGTALIGGGWTLHDACTLLKPQGAGAHNADAEQQDEATRGRSRRSSVRVPPPHLEHDDADACEKGLGGSLALSTRSLKKNASTRNSAAEVVVDIKSPDRPAQHDEVLSYLEQHSDADFLPPSCSSHISSRRGSLSFAAGMLQPQVQAQHPLQVPEGALRSPFAAGMLAGTRTPPCLGTNPKSSWAASDTESRAGFESAVSTPMAGGLVLGMRGVAVAKSPSGANETKHTVGDLRSPLSLVNALAPVAPPVRRESTATVNTDAAESTASSSQRRRPRGSFAKNARRAADCNREQGFEFH